MARPITPLLAADGVVVVDGSILLIRRAFPPFKGGWALPGGSVDVGETVEEAVVREVCEETGLEVEVKELIGVYSDPARDSRGHTVAVAFLCGVLGGKIRAGDDAADARFFTLDELPELAFDHKKIVEDARKLMETGKL